jgi:hypothetical protein
MKKFLINSTSNLMSAAVIGGVLAFAAAPAHAWGDREQGILTGIIGTLIIQDINRGNTQQGTVVVQQPQHIHYHNNYSVERCGYQENVFRNGYSTVVERRNSCTGQLIERRETFNK